MDAFFVTGFFHLKNFINHKPVTENILDNRLI